MCTNQMFCSVFRLEQLIKYSKNMRVCVCVCVCVCGGLPGSSVGQESACNTGDTGSISGLGRSHGERHGSPLQYSCLENCMDRGAWQAIAHGVTESRTRLKRLSRHVHTCECVCGSASWYFLPNIREGEDWMPWCLQCLRFGDWVHIGWASSKRLLLESGIN